MPPAGSPMLDFDRFRTLTYALLLCSGLGIAASVGATSAASVSSLPSSSSPAPTNQLATNWQSNLRKPAKPMSLREAVLLAVRSNASLRTAYLDRVLDRFRLDYAKAEFLPQGNLRLAHSQNRDQAALLAQRQAAALDVALALPSGGKIEFAWTLERQRDNGTAAVNAGLSLQLTQPLLRGAGRQIAESNVRLADIAESQAKLQLRGTVMATMTAVISAYRSLQEARVQVGLANDALKRSQMLAGINQTLVDAGRLGRLELLQTQADIAAGELEVIEAETRADNARLTLLKLLDMDLLSDIVPEDINLGEAKSVTRTNLADASTVTSRLPSEAQALALAEALRPDFLSVKLSEQASLLGWQKARDQTLWQLDLVLSATRRAQAGNAPQALNDLSNGRSAHFAGVVLNIPLNDRAAGLALSTADIERKKNAVRISDVHQSLRVEVMNALRNAWSSARHSLLAGQNLELNRQKLDAELAKLAVGRTSLFQVSSFQQSLKQAEQTRINALIAQANALTQLDLALGTTLQTWEIVLD